MSLKPFIVAILTGVIVSFLSVFAPPVFAEGNQSNQAINQPSVLVAPEPSFQINVYPKPGSEKQRIGYGLGGDRVTVLEKVGSNQGYIWNYVQFANSSQLKGWIREEFVTADSQQSQQSQSNGNPHSFFQKEGSSQQGSSFQKNQNYWGDRAKQQHRGNQQQAQ